MLDSTGKVIYVGKAKNLKKRVSSYFSGTKDPKTAHMLSMVADIQITITRTEVEALLLEFQLIRQLKPRYNIIFRDDKSYPYIYLSTQEDFPQLTFYRGNTDGPGEYFGPYPSTRSVRDSIDLLQRTFQIRQCDKNYFKSRTRPCLQHQIKRCTAPCVGLVDKTTYAQDVRNVQLFLLNRTDEVIQQLVAKMEQASDQQDYEQAARLRDQIHSMRMVQQQQIISDPNASQNVDILGVAYSGRFACVHVLSIRDGRMLGSRQYFPVAELNMYLDIEMILQSFLLQYYANLPRGNLFPAEILVPARMTDAATIADGLKEYHHRAVKIAHAVRGDRAKWLEMAKESAAEGLKSRLSADAQLEQQMLELGRALDLSSNLKRIECFDVSHTRGEGTIASCVVFDQSGPLKSAYRRFKIKTAGPSDDYAAMEEALKRHFVKVQQTHGEFPDLLLIDGGKGQLARAEKVCHELALNGVKILGIAKGPSRKPGLEKLFLAPHAQEIILKPDSNALHLLQRVRDEAHRFAITGHRSIRGKRQLHSVLEDIPGIGAQRRRELLRKFGGLQEVLCATVEELAAVPGISMVLAQRIHEALNVGKEHS
jgi:excinuclease ABC subunit C